MEKKYIQDKEGAQILPITHISAVRDDAGNTLDSILANNEQALLDESNRAKGAELTLQNNINAESTRALAAENDRYTKSETYNKNQLNSMITTPEQGFVTLTAEDGDTLADIFDGVTGAADTIYRVGSWDGSQYDTTKYTEYAFDGTNFIPLDVKEHGIDDEPTAGSRNLVESGGVETSLDAIKSRNIGPNASASNFEQGTINTQGEPVGSTIRIRSKKSYNFEPGVLYNIIVATGYQASLYFYNNSTFVDFTSYGVATFQKSNANNFKVVIRKDDSEAEIAPSDAVSANLSIVRDEDYVLSLSPAVVKTLSEQADYRENIDAFEATKVIFGSSTDQLLDISKVVKGVYINSTGVGHLVSDKKGIISYPIYIGNLPLGTKLTFSGVLNAAYLSGYEIKDSNFVRSISVSGQRTDEINMSVKYVIVSLQTTSDVDYSSAKVSIGESVSENNYRGYYLGLGGQEEKFDLYGRITSIEETDLLDKQMDANIWGSSTNQLLDLNAVVNGYTMSASGLGSFVKSDKGRAISKPIYVGHLAYKTVYVSAPNSNTNIVFLSKFGINDSYCVAAYNVYSPGRELTVPGTAKYAVITVKPTVNYDPTGMKLSIGSEETTDSYSAKYLGIAGNEENFQVYDEVDSLVTNEQMSKLIYGSKTNQLLDVKAIVNGYYATYSGSGTIIEDAKGIVSKPIYVGHLKGQELTLSGYQSAWGVGIVFLSAFGLNTSLCVAAKSGSGTSRNGIIVPNNALYAVITLQNPLSSSYPYDYTSMKLSIGSTESIDNYVQEFIGIVGDEKNFYKESSPSTYYDHVLINERNDVEKRAIPYAIGTSSDTFVWDTHYNRLNLMFMTDSHIDSWPESKNNVMDAVNFAKNTGIGINAFIHGGDFITPFGIHTKASSKALAKEYFDMIKENTTIPFIQTIGNHDLNDWQNYPADAFTDADWDEMFFAWQRSTFGSVHNTSGSYSGKSYQSPYCYYDIDDFKVRIISINELDFPHGDEWVTQQGTCLYYGSGCFYIRQEQFDWLINEALDFSDKDEKDWGIILLGHATETRGVNNANGETVVPLEDSAIEKVLLVLKALNTQSTYSSTYVNNIESEFNLSIDADFTEYSGLAKKPYVIAFICGHDHYDKNYVKHGINIIQTINSAAGIYSSDGRINRVRGTQTQNAFDIFTIDTTTKKIYSTRFGAGGINCFGDHIQNGNDSGDRFKPNGLSY